MICTDHSSHFSIDYRLLIVCSNEAKGKSHVISRLHSYHRNWKWGEKQQLKEYVTSRLVQRASGDKLPGVNASIIDNDKYKLSFK